MQHSPLENLSHALAVDSILQQTLQEDHSKLYIAIGCLITGSEQSDEVSDNTLLSIASDLSQQGWITTETIIDQGTLQITRISVLPHDAARAYIDRGSSKLEHALMLLVRSLDISPQTWIGNYSGSMELFDPFATPLGQSLFYAFNSLPSPAPNLDLFDRVRHEYIYDVMADIINPIDQLHLYGVTTRLYAYQKRSTAMMLQREIAPGRVLDPRLEQRCGPDGSIFYYNARDGAFHKDESWYDSCSGGILAESMGLGKTLICLALICATRLHLPKIPTQYLNQDPPTRVVPLKELAIRCIQQNSVPWRVEHHRMMYAGSDVALNLASLLEGEQITYDIPQPPPRWNRNTVMPAPRTITLAWTTIVVVPRNLCLQWQSEIAKHIKADELEVLVMDDLKKELPAADELRKYNVILFSRNRFEAEANDGSDSTGRRMPPAHSAKVCHCPYIGNSRERACTCLTTEDLYDSPLKHLHFKRLIIDEGHSFGAKNTRAVQVANQLVIADSRWVVSGTPAKDLLGVELDVLDMDTEDVAAQRAMILEQRRAYGVYDDHTGAAKSLGALATNFLRVSPWCSVDGQPASSWDDYIYRHEDIRKRTYSSFSLGLKRTLQAIVIKTRYEDAENDIKLPPLHHKVVRLEPAYHDKLTANLFAMVLITNAVTSERLDQDYLFHSRNQKSRQELVKNLRQSSFCWTGFSEADVLSTLQNAAKYLSSPNLSNKCSKDDQDDLMDVCRFVKQVILSDKAWRMLAQTHEVGIYVSDWPEESAKFWNFVKDDSPLLTGISHLSEAQNHVDSRMGETDPGEGLAGLGVRIVKAATNSQHTDRQPSAVGNETMTLMTGEPKLLRRSARNQDRPKHRTGNAEITNDLYTSTTIVGTTSAKLSYLISRICELQKDEKILVFYEGDNVAFYIAQALELLHIKHEIYAKSLMASLKSAYVAKFNEQPADRVLLMDVKQAAFGLNITSASRIFFVTPVCRPAIEAQAIKRAHRIGQTREVFCETLILKGTIEEQLYERSLQMTNAEHLQARALEDDRGIRAIIENATLIPIAEAEDVTEGQVARIERPQQLWGRRHVSTTEESTPIAKRKRATKASNPPAKKPRQGATKSKTAPKKKVSMSESVVRETPPVMGVRSDANPQPAINETVRDAFD